MSLTKDDLREIKTVMTETILEVVPVIMQPRFDGIDQRLDAMDDRFDAMEARFDAVDVDLAEIRTHTKDHTRRIARLERREG